PHKMPARRKRCESPIIHHPSDLLGLRLPASSASYQPGLSAAQRVMPIWTDGCCSWRRRRITAQDNRIDSEPVVRSKRPRFWQPAVRANVTSLTEFAIQPESEGGS